MGVSALCAVTLGAAGCSIDERAILADYIDIPFGKATSEVLALDDDELAGLMDELQLRFSLYLELRSVVDLGAVALDACLTSFEDASTGLRFTLDMGCVYADVPGARGEVRIVEDAPGGSLVSMIDIAYDDIVVSDFSVGGFEYVTETGGDDGTSIRRLDLTQRGVDFAYEFRLGLLEDGRVVFDYVLDRSDGSLQARLIPGTIGGVLADVTLTGGDGEVSCQLRDVPWQPGDPARGFCDSGQSFGLPDGELVQ